MPLPPPGYKGPTERPELDEPMTFVAEIASAKTLYFGGIPVEWFYSREFCEDVVVGDRVYAMFVPEVQQVFVLGKIS